MAGLTCKQMMFYVTEVKHMWSVFMHHISVYTDN